MKNRLPNIYFYIPEDQLIGDVPSKADDYWQWRISMASKYRFMGQFDWTIQTYLRLKDNKFPCELVHSPSYDGIVLSHYYFLMNVSRPGNKTLMVSFKGDTPSHPYAQLHVVQSPVDMVKRRGGRLSGSFYMPHWVQPGLLARDESRGDKFENIGYCGNDIQLAEEFRDPLWSDTLKKMGYNWIMKTSPANWYDYRDLDAFVAIRRCRAGRDIFKNKPATKLYNAWHAKIPAILGREAAYMAERKSEPDYIEAVSKKEVIKALERLRDNPELRREMVSNGIKRAEETMPEIIVKRWEYFLREVASPLYYEWCESEQIRERYFLRCEIKIFCKNIKNFIVRILKVIFEPLLIVRRWIRRRMR